MSSTQTSTAPADEAPLAVLASADGPSRPLGGARGALDRYLPESPVRVIECENVDIYYEAFRAVHEVSLTFGHNEITAMIGPSGCGKSTVLRCLNRMNDLIPDARVTGRIAYHGQD